VFSTDGLSAYFTIANHPQNIGGKRDPGDIWISQLLDGQWTTPVHGGSLLNDAGYNGVAGFSLTGDQMFLLSHYGSSGLAKTQGLSVARKSGSGWARPENISIPYFQNKSTIVSGYVTPDGSVFVYSAETYGSYGVEDIFVSLKNPDGNWTAPKNLGANINTTFQELCPSVSPDGKTLYFSTNGRKGLGSFDIYSATRLDDAWTKWSEPKNLGSQVNTEGRDLYFRTYSGSPMATYTSTVNSDGYGDVKLYVSEELKVEDKPVVDVVETIPPIVQEDEKGIKLFGKISNAKTGEPINATISFVNADEEKKIQSDASGYEMRITPPSKYTVRITAPGFISTMENLNVEENPSQPLEMNWNLQPAERGTTVNLKSVLFEQSKPNLLPESFSELDLVVTFLQSNPDVAIELSGHTDNRGVQRDNVKLSQDRVETVKEYLVSQGIDAKRISGKGYGGTKPIANNDNVETRKLNRRVEFTIK
jgi:outer membrane protein OmpA-like peptidoglycan-associated protein